MTDTKESVREARARLKQIAGRMLARKEAHEARIAELERQAATLASDLAAAEGRPALQAELNAAMEELALVLTNEREAAALAAQDLEAALRDLGSMGDVERDADRAALQAAMAAVQPDPYDADPAARALENVREHAAELEARVRLGRPPDTRTDPATPVDPEADAKQKLAELKAQRKRRNGEGGGGGRTL